MKWIGQHIYDQISRFRNHTYFEDSVTLSTGKSITMDEYTSGTISITKIQDSGTTFNDNDTSLMTAAAIADKIEAYGYSTTTGDITGVTITTDSGGGSAASDTSGSADFSILGSNGVGVTNSGTTITAVAVPAEIDHDSLNNYNDEKHFTQSNITTTGTITSGTWQGDAIASAYLDADTAHLSGAQTFTGTKTLNSFKGTGSVTVTNILDEDAMGTNSNTALATQQSIKAYADTKVSSAATKQVTHHNYKADQDTTETYVSLADADSEGTSTTNNDLPFTAPVAGKLLKVFLRSDKNINGHTLTWRLRTISSGSNMSSTPSVVGTQSGAGCQNSTMTTYDFTTGLDSGANTIAAADSVFLTLESDTDFGGNVKYYITCLWEWDLS